MNKNRVNFLFNIIFAFPYCVGIVWWGYQYFGFVSVVEVCFVLVVRDVELDFFIFRVDSGDIVFTSVFDRPGNLFRRSLISEGFSFFFTLVLQLFFCLFRVVFKNLSVPEQKDNLYWYFF